MSENCDVIVIFLIYGQLGAIRKSFFFLVTLFKIEIFIRSLPYGS